MPAQPRMRNLNNACLDMNTVGVILVGPAFGTAHRIPRFMMPSVLHPFAAAADRMGPHLRWPPLPGAGSHSDLLSDPPPRSPAVVRLQHASQPHPMAVLGRPRMYNIPE
jgi:hypothetical protein